VVAVHTIGGVVTPAQALLVVVPLKSHVEVEAMVSNRDIGFVSPRAGHGDQGRDLQLRALWPAQHRVLSVSILFRRGVRALTQF
jgi:hypothetical protein